MLIIRQATVNDIDSILQIYRPSIELTTTSFEYVVPTHQEYKKRFASITQKHPFFVCEDTQNHQVVGYAYCSDAFERKAFSWNAEISIYIDQLYQGRRIGKAFALLCQEVMKSEGYTKIYSLVSAENTSSIAFHRALGFDLLATLPKAGNKFGRWVDLLWYQKDIAPFASNPPLPLKFNELSIVTVNKLIEQSQKIILQN